MRFIALTPGRASTTVKNGTRCLSCPLYLMGHELTDEFLHFDTLLEDAERWRNRAEEMRVIAEEMISEANKAVARNLAASYERLAVLAEKRAQSSKRIR